MTEQEVRQMIAKETEALHNAIFPGELPMWITQNFKEMIMRMPQRENQYFARTIKNIASKGDRVGTLTVFEAGFLLNVWTNVAPEVLGVDFDEFARRKEVLEPIVAGFNSMMKKEEYKLARKQESFMKNIRKPAPMIHSV